MADYCLFCYGEIMPVISWRTIFLPEEPNYFCEECEGRLEEIQGPVCKKCSRPLAKLAPEFVKGDLCNDCVRWEEDPRWEGLLQENKSLYVYNEFLKECLSLYKYRGDYLIAKAFSEKIRKTLKQLSFDLLVPIPLSKERLYERGFNQSAALIEEAGFTAENVLRRIHGEKQSKKSRLERIHLQQVFQMADNINIEGKKIVLVDDIYTTGSTLRHAAKVLVENGARSVSSFTLARGE